MRRASYSFYSTLYKFADILLLLVATYVTNYIRFRSSSIFDNNQMLLFLMAMLSWFISVSITHFYSPEWRPDIFNKLKVTGKTTIYFMAIMSVGAFTFKEVPFSRLQMAMLTIFQGVAVFAVHEFIINVVKCIRMNNRNSVNVLIIGAGPMGERMAHELRILPESSKKFVGYLDDVITGEKVLGEVNDLEKIIKAFDIQEVIVALSVKHLDLTRDIFTECDEMGVRVHKMLDYFRWYNNHIEINYFGSLLLATARKSPLDEMKNKFWKRAFDITLAGTGLLMLSPILALFAVLVKLSSKGPSFFVQKRTGYNQKEFNCYKFRSMRLSDDADKIQATENDPRKTKVGDFMRKTNIDELPQLLNVLKGEMSLVGPRPHMLEHTTEFKSKVTEYMHRHYVKPGITGWAQVNGWRGPTDTQEKIEKRVQFDLEYIENWDLLMDIKIILMTVFSKKSKENAF